MFAPPARCFSSSKRDQHPRCSRSTGARHRAGQFRRKSRRPHTFPARISRLRALAANTAKVLIRDFRVGDEPDLHQVFLSAIHRIAIDDCTPEQVNAWAPRTLDPVLWADRVRGIAPFVMEHEGKPIAYADIQPDGYIDHFFVSAPLPDRYRIEADGSNSR
jgi:hypothetical protein